MMAKGAEIHIRNLIPFGRRVNTGGPPPHDGFIVATARPLPLGAVNHAISPRPDMPTLRQCGGPLALL